MTLRKDLKAMVADLKSAKEISADAFHSEVSQKRDKVDSLTRQTVVRMNDDGQVVVCKRANPGVVEFLSEGGSFKIRATDPESGTTFTPEQLQKFAADINLPWRDDYATRIIPVFSSDERPDRAGDIVMQEYQMENYNRNPLVLFSHMWEGLPIGNSLNHEVVDRAETDYEGPALRQLLLFATEDQSPFADSVFRLMQAKLLRTVSIGFYPGKILQVEDENERKELGLGRWGVIMSQNEMIEVSPTSVPANPGALDASIRSLGTKGLLKPTDANVIREIMRVEIRKGRNDASAWKEIDCALRTAFSSIFDVTFKAHSALDEPINVGEVVVNKKEDESRVEKLLSELSTKVESLETRLDEIQLESDKAEAETAAVLQSQREQQELDEAIRTTLALSDEALDSCRRVSGTTKA